MTVEARRRTYREDYEEDILYYVAPDLVTNSHSRGPCSPIRTFRVRVGLPTAERSIQIELASVLDIAADTRFHIS